MEIPGDVFKGCQHFSGEYEKSMALPVRLPFPFHPAHGQLISKETCL